VGTCRSAMRKGSWVGFEGQRLTVGFEKEWLRTV
jgi:hypothetical protein